MKRKKKKTMKRKKKKTMKRSRRGGIRMTPGSTRKDLSFSNSNRRSRSRRVSTIHRSMNSNQLNPRKISFGKTRRRLSFNKSLDKRKKKKKKKKKKLIGDLLEE